jgi:type IV secretory pathway TraG/TraD family ATPase VirD4
MASSRTEIQRPFPFTDAHPKFRVRGWRRLLGKAETLAAGEMVRHFLATGETGCGKSVSAVMRLLEAILRYPEDDLYAEYAITAGSRAESQETLRPSVLIVDPKQELGSIVEREARGRKVTRLAFGEPGPVFHMFEGRDLSRMSAVEAMDMILAQSDFYTQDQASTREPSWGQQAADAVTGFVGIDMWLARQGMDKVRALWDKVSETLEGDSDFKAIAPSVKYDPVNYFRPMAAMFALSSSEGGSLPIAVYLDACNDFKVPGELMLVLVSLVTLWHSTRSGVVYMANGILDALSNAEFASCVSLNPIEPPPVASRLSLKDVVNAGDIVLYVPTLDPSSIGDMVARCLKTKFFEFAFQRDNKARPLFYVVDEFHRFIAGGEQDGEQSLLDRCRAYRTGAVLATQSIASMAYRLQNEPGGGKNALDIILNNCGNAMYFRTSDIQTQSNVQSRIPAAPVANRPHVMRVRPLASLDTGVCYALRCDGSWGLFKVHLPD